MVINFENLQFRKNKVRQPMQYAWCAATKKNFLGPDANKISKKEIIDLDIGSLCDDIIAEMSDSQERTRCTLSLLTMLSYGGFRLFQQQAIFLKDDCEKLKMDLLGGQDFVAQKKKKKRTGQKTDESPSERNISFTPLSLPKVDITKILTKKDAIDRHLILEMDFIDIPESYSFGFNPNERDLTDRELDELYRDMMGENAQQSVVLEDMPQDNEAFEMKDAPMNEAVDSIEKQLFPPAVPQPEVMKTPKKQSTHPRKAGEKSSASCESAKTAYSPPKKRKRASLVPQEANIDDLMLASEPIREPSLPHDVLNASALASPVFEFKRSTRQRNVSPSLGKNLAQVVEKGKAIAARLCEQMLDVPVQPESPPPVGPVDEAPVNLPETSFAELPPENVEPEDNSATHTPNVSIHDSKRVCPPSSSKMSDNLTLDTLHSFEVNPRKKYIKKGKHIFADRIRTIDIEPRSPIFMTIPREEAMYTHALKHQSVISLFNCPATMKNTMYLPTYRCWSNDLLNRFLENLHTLKVDKVQKRKKKGNASKEQSEDQEQHIENLEIIREQRQSSLPKDIDMNDVQVFNAPDQTVKSTQRSLPEDIRMDKGTTPPALDSMNETTNHQVTNDAAHEFEQPPVVEPEIEEFRAPDPVDHVEMAMSPRKKFKSRDDKDLQDKAIRSKEYLTDEKLFQIIQSLWDKLTESDIDRLGSILVEYEKVIKPDCYTKVEAGRYLQRCFVLENKHKLQLEQKLPYDPVYLKKWPAVA